MKENETRGLSPAAYTTPASVFNTVAVVFEQSEDIIEPVLKTCPIQMENLKKLDPEVPDSVKKISTLERTPSRSSTGSATPKMGSLERKSAQNSLERSHSSLDKSGMFSPKLGSLERRSRNSSPKTGGSPKMGSLERTKITDIDSIPNYHPDPVLYQLSDKGKDGIQFEESIYDFGGADVKSCAHKQPFFIAKVQENKVQEQKQVRIKHVRLVSNFIICFNYFLTILI